MQTRPTRMRLAANSAAVLAATKRRQPAWVRSLSFAGRARSGNFRDAPGAEAFGFKADIACGSRTRAMLFLSSAPLVDGNIVPLRRARIDLPRPSDLLRRVLDHLLPLRDPTDGPCEREQ